MSMKTDPARIRKDDPGHPEICTVYAYHELFNDKDRHAEIGRACRAERSDVSPVKRNCRPRSRRSTRRSMKSGLNY